MRKNNYLKSFFTMFVAAALSATSMAQAPVLEHVSSYQTGVFDEGAAEIAGYDAVSQRIFFTNADANTIDVLDASDISNLTLLYFIDLSPYGDGINSLVVVDGHIAAAVEADPKQDPGSIVIFDIDGNFVSSVTAGALPDMVTVTPDGTKLIVANEGEPNDDYDVDPEGTISVIDITSGFATLTDANVTTLNFNAYDGQELPGVRIFGPGATVSQDLEPEYVAVAPDSQTAYVVCQENNAIAIVDLVALQVVDLVALGTKDYSLPQNAIDASNDDDEINITTWPVKSFYMPDAMKALEIDGQAYIITANEGDARDYDGYSEEDRVKDLVLDPTVFPNAEWLQEDENLGRLNITTTSGDTDNDGDFDEIYGYGARSFSVWDASGNLVWDSGSQFEQIIANRYPNDFNSNNDENDSFDKRSDDKGPEPEAIEYGTLNGVTYAFIGLERMGGIMMYDLSDPSNPEFVQYVNNRDFSGDAEAGTAGDLGVEDLTFVPAEDSPNGNALLISSNEVSGTVSVFQFASEPYALQILHASDLEGGVDAIERAPNFAAIVDQLEGTYDNSITLSAGDNYIPGPFFNASADGSMRPVLQDVYQDLYSEPGLDNIREGGGRADISIMNIIGFDASALGNHEFDATTDAINGIIAPNITGSTLSDVRWLGAQFPYLSANLDFSNDGNLNYLYTDEVLMNTEFQSLLSDLDAAANAPKIAPSTLIEEGGELIGVVGATTQLLASISSPGQTEVITGGSNDMVALAAVLQPVIDDLMAAGSNKIILVSHLQQISLEEELATLLNGVDVIIAGGSDTILANVDDRLLSGSEADADYPVVTSNADGDPTLIVSTDGEYSYVGRLVVNFNEEGVVLPEFLNSTVNGPYIADAEMVEELWEGEDAFAENSKGELVSRITDAVQDVVIAKDGNVFGKTAVYLDGRRSEVRTEETNLGDITADANLWVAQQFDSEVQVSIKNGGGIRAAIGQVVEVSPGVYEFLPPQANPLSGKEEQEVSQLDIENSLRFNNRLTVLSLSASDLKEVMEHGFASVAPGSTPGSFPQIGGINVVYDPEAPAGDRIFTLQIVDGNGDVVDTVVSGGEIVGDPAREIKTVTLNFLAGGGDGYPFDSLGENPVDLDEQGLEEGNATFTIAGSEQDAMAEYLAEFFAVDPYNQEETESENDTRIKTLQDALGCDVVASLPLIDGFENGFENWMNVEGDDFDWSTRSTQTPSFYTGPEEAFEGNYYFYIESSSPNSPMKTAEIVSPCIDLNEASTPYANFHYHMFGDNTGTLSLEASLDGNTYETLWTLDGEQSEEWMMASVNLEDYIGSNVKLRFSATTGMSWKGDIAIDAFELIEATPGCTDETACNYDAGADANDGSCEYLSCNDCLDIAALPLNSDFETDLGEWEPAEGNDLEWTLNSGSTSSYGTGPSEAFEQYSYAYLEASFNGSPDKSASIVSPCIDLTGATAPYLSFAYHLYGSQVGSLAIEVSTGGEFMTVWSMEGNQGDEWMTAELELSDYIGQSVQLRITGTTGTTYSSDIAIDAVSVFEGILGCTDETACNYNEDATLSDNSCDYFSCATCEQVDTESYQQGFEDGTVDWTQETEDDIDWTLNVGSTPSFGTGPQMASEEDFYLFIESSYPNYGGHEAILQSPCFELAEGSQYEVSFDYHMYGSSMGALELQISDDQVNWTSIWSLSGNQGNAWQTAQLDVSEYAPSSVKFRFVANTGSSYFSDVAIDAFNLESITPAEVADAGNDNSEDEKTTLGLNDAFDQENSFKLYPNPTREIVNFEIEVAQEEQVSLYLTDLSGKLIKTEQMTLNSGTQQIVYNVSDLPAGFYNVRIQGADFALNAKLVINR
jgi:2',3'-cyclic-nucleotide 2'-phosphodiesterase (5'-nucleotidase family)